MTHDAINNPSHYAEGRQYEPIAVIEDWELNYRLGNAVKYISRAGRKLDAVEDLRKAVWYLQREIDSLEGAQSPYAPEYEDVLDYYGQTQDEKEAWPDVPFTAGKEDWEDFWNEADSEPRMYASGWDPSLGPVEVPLKRAEVDAILAKKDLNQFSDDEIVSTVERRGMIIGFKKDGSSCVLRDGKCS